VEISVCATHSISQHSSEDWQEELILIILLLAVDWCCMSLNDLLTSVSEDSQSEFLSRGVEKLLCTEPVVFSTKSVAVEHIEWSLWDLETNLET